jgi:hypothetical protein
LKPTTKICIEALTSAKVWASMILIATLAAGLQAQTLQSVTVESHPGETVRLLLSFDGPVELTGASANFSLMKLNNEAQTRWPKAFNIGRLKPATESKTKWELTGEIPAYTASGVYHLIWVSLNVADLAKSYDWPIPGHPPIDLTVVNDRKDPMRPLTDVQLIVGK